MDVDFVERSVTGSWHDAINCTVRNNIISHGAGAGISFYSARDIEVSHNTLVDVAMSSQAAILFNLSPKLIDHDVQLYPENENIVISGNLIQSGGSLSLPMIESRVMQASVNSVAWPPLFPTESNNCTSRRLSSTSRPQHLRKESQRIHDKVKLSSVPFPLPTGTQGRNSDGTCPQFPDDNLWHLDVSSLPVHPNSEGIKMLISSGGRVHHDFAGGVTVNGKFIPYGIPITTVNTLGSSPQPLVPLTIAPTGYPDECDYPLLYPFPGTAPVEGAYLNCPDSTCSGDRHVLVLDNSTCTLYETWRSFPPGVTSAGWVADIAVKWNLQSNNLRPLGYTSSDAAGLPVLPGLVQFDEVIHGGEIKHALRFTGPNSRAAYSLPATHFAPAGNTGSDSPWMGMRIRLKSSFDCSGFARASRVFCVALQKYGGIFADNGSPWYFSGEGTAAWNAYLGEFADMSKIAASDIEVLDSGCLCLSADCSLSDCGNGVQGGLPVHAAVKNYSTVHLSQNVYWNKHGHGARFTDRKAGYLGAGYDGDLSGWNSYTDSDGTSAEMDPEVDSNTFHLKSTSPALLFADAPDPNSRMTDFYGRPVLPSVDGKVEVGVIFGVDFVGDHPSASPSRSPSLIPSPIISESTFPTFSPSANPTRLPSRVPTNSPTLAPTFAPSTRPTRAPTLVPSFKPSPFPSAAPSPKPTGSPTFKPTKSPSSAPSSRPTGSPTFKPTKSPSSAPSPRPTRSPTVAPTKFPSSIPSVRPSWSPSFFPTRRPTALPTKLN
jgi:parallel beta-helix repeat protein